MRLVLFGKPGSGKGTQAQKIAEKWSLVPISTGDLVRKTIKEGQELGRLYQSYIQQGFLVPDELIFQMLKSYLEEQDLLDNFLLDGFPRTLTQVELLDKWLTSKKAALDGVLYLDVPDQVVVERLAGRRFCPKDGTLYHLPYLPPQKDLTRCDLCGTELAQRSDDQQEVVLARLVEYAYKTMPILEVYAMRGILYKIPGGLALPVVAQKVEELLQMIARKRAT